MNQRLEYSDIINLIFYFSMTSLCQKSICGYLPLTDLEKYYQSINRQMDVRLLTAYIQTIKRAETYLPTKPGRMNMILCCEECRILEAIPYTINHKRHGVIWSRNHYYSDKRDKSDSFLCRACSLDPVDWLGWIDDQGKPIS